MLGSADAGHFVGREAELAEFVLRRTDGSVVLWDCFAPLSDVPEAGPLTDSLRSAGRPARSAAVSFDLTTGPRVVSISDFRPRGAVGFVEAIVLAEQGFEPREPGNADLLADTHDPERAARLREALDVVFGDTPEDRRLRAILEAVHLGPRRSEASLLAEFHVGRTTWYRLLRTARERVLAHRRASSGPTSVPTWSAQAVSCLPHRPPSNTVDA